MTVNGLCKGATLWGVALAGVVLALAGCGDSTSSATGSAAPSASDTLPGSSASARPSGGGSASSSAPAESAMITIKDFGYSGSDSVAPGSTVTVQNDDDVAHTVTADDSSGGFDVKIDAGSSATFEAPTKAGSYAYHCTYHSNMHGTLKVG